jgi:hypothetical protein
MTAKLILKHWSYGAGMFFALIFGYIAFPHIQSYAVGMVLTIENSSPILHRSFIANSESLNAQDVRPITLIGGELAPYKAVAQVSDGNGFGDIFYAEAVFYRSGVEAGKDCKENEHDCYRGSTADGVCRLVADSARDGRVICDFDFAYFMEPTLGDRSGKDKEEWILHWKVTDYSGELIESNDYRNEVATLLHLRFPEVLNYGTIALGQSSYTNAAITIENLGNVPARLQVLATPLICERGEIFPSAQQIDIEEGDFVKMSQSHTSLALSEQEQIYPWLEIPTGETNKAGKSVIYSTLTLPTSGIAGDCTGGLHLNAY